MTRHLEGFENLAPDHQLPKKTWSSEDSNL